MNVAWGSRLTGETKGLDVMGIRALDQNIEASLTNGLTTISIRARYISILPWAIGQYFVHESAGGRVRHDKDALAVYLNRVRFLVLAATFVDEGASRIGTMGSDFYLDEMAVVITGKTVRMPDGGNLAVLGTYFGPASALGFVESRPESSGLPFGLTARGTAMYQERSTALGSSRLVVLLRDGGDLDYNTAREAVSAFSLARIADFGREAGLLREAFEQPWVPGSSIAAKRVAQAYQRMTDTRSWLHRELTVEPANANELIARNYDRAVLEGADGIELEWASFEWHRRVHFALELLLAAMTRTLLDDGSMSVAQVIAIWSSHPVASEPLTDHWNSPADVAALTVQPGAFSGGLLRPADFHLEPHIQAIRAFEILVTQARDAQSIGVIPGANSGASAPSARAIQLVGSGTGTLGAVLHAICDECVAQRHIANTMRKMGNHQDCSLRFYPDGPVLVPTDIDFSPNYSGSRLQNTMRILGDIGMLSVASSDVSAADVVN